MSLTAAAMTRPSRHRRLSIRIATVPYGGSGLFFQSETPGYHVVDRALTPFHRSDWDTCCFCHVGADLVNYPSKVVAPAYAGA